MFSLEQPAGHLIGFRACSPVTITVDNSLSPSHTLIQILCQDHKGLIYDIMRTVKDCNIQVSYGRFFSNPKGNCEVDLFIMQADGKKIVDPNKQDALCSRLRMELLHSLRVAVVEIGRHMINDREWEVYRILHDETDEDLVPRNKIQDLVRKILMGWE
ncbi:hypothetical protein QYF36_017269 [Acer negundo]|nr:hypothetical protein QYF36_017269 [Acer negundo]